MRTVLAVTEDGQVESLVCLGLVTHTSLWFMTLHIYLYHVSEISKASLLGLKEIIHQQVLALANALLRTYVRAYVFFNSL